MVHHNFLIYFCPLTSTICIGKQECVLQLYTDSEFQKVLITNEFRSLEKKKDKWLNVMPLKKSRCI